MKRKGIDAGHSLTRAGRIVKKTVACLCFGALAFAATVIWVSDAAVAAQCFCVISKDNLTNKKERSGQCKDLTGEVNTNYVQNDKNQRNCNEDCKNKAKNYTGSQAIATACCGISAPNGADITAYAALGNRKYESAHGVGTLINKAAVTATTCTCPKGWIGDRGVDGGVTTNAGKCTRLACQPILHAPYPPDDTKIGTGSPLPWGFSWGNAFYQFGSAANGGAPKCETHIVSPAECRLR